MSDATASAAVASSAPASTPTAPSTSAPAPAPKDAAPSAPPTESATPLPSKYRVKVDGQEKEVPLEELTKNYELRSASYHRMEKAARDVKQAQSLVAALRDPRRLQEVLRAAGHDPRSLSEQWLAEALRMEGLPPHERARLEVEQQRAQFEAERRQFQEQQARVELDRQTAVEQQRYQAAFNKALVDAKLPQSPWAIRRMASLQMEALDRGLDVTPAELADLVREELQAEASAYVKALDPATLEALFGEQVQALRQRDVARLQATPPGAKPVQPTERARNPQNGQFEPQRKLTFDQKMAELDKRRP